MCRTMHAFSKERTRRSRAVGFSVGAAHRQLTQPTSADAAMRKQRLKAPPLPASASARKHHPEPEPEPEPEPPPTVSGDAATPARASKRFAKPVVRKQRLRPPPLPKSSAASHADPTPGSQIHVRGVGGKFEAEAAIIGVFARFGPVVQATVRHRIDKATGANTSWALVTMESRDSAEAVLAAASSLPAPLTVTRFSKEQADSSQGQMGMVRREAAAKMIQSFWRRQLAYRAYREALMKEAAHSTIVGLTRPTVAHDDE